MDVAARPDRAIADLRALADLTGGPGGARRLCWTPEWDTARRFLRDRLSELPVTVDVDEAGNLWARLPGARPEAVVIGSHIDSVPNGGWLDGALGVLGALEVLRTIAAAGTPPCTVTLVDFADEEGARFGRSLFGSSWLSGSIRADDVRDLHDAAGDRLADVVAEYGVDLDRAGAASRRLADVRAYLELHIEQGPVLESCRSRGRDGARHRRRRAPPCRVPRAGRPLRVDADAEPARLVPGRRAASRSRCATAPSATRRRHDRRCRLHARRRHRRPGRHHRAARPAPPRRGRARRHARRGEGKWRRGRGGRAAARSSSARIWQIDPIPFDPDLIAAARSACQAVSGSDHALPSGPLHDAAEMARQRSRP